MAIRHNYKKRLCQTYTILGTYYSFVQEDYPEAFKAFEEALKISAEVKDIITLVLASAWFGNALGFNCDFEKASNCYQRALDINVAVNNLWGIAVMKSNLAWSSYYYAGKIDLGFQATLESVRIAEESGDIYSKAWAHNLHGTFCHGKGFLEEAEKHLLLGVGLCERINFHSQSAWARLNLGETYFEMGDFSKSKENFEKSSCLLDNNRMGPSLANLGKVGFTRSKVMNREEDVDLESLYAYSRNIKLKILEGWFPRYIGEILLNIDDQHLSESEHWIQKAIEADQRNRMMFNVGKDYALYAELFKRKGERLKAQENLGKAIETLKKCGADGWVIKAEKELIALS